MRSGAGLTPPVLEVATGRRVIVETGADGRDGIVTYRYEDETKIRTTTREAFFLCGYFVSAPASAKAA